MVGASPVSKSQFSKVPPEELRAFIASEMDL
jgi:hypothetical protein